MTWPDFLGLLVELVLVLPEYLLLIFARAGSTYSPETKPWPNVVCFTSNDFLERVVPRISRNSPGGSTPKDNASPSAWVRYK